MFRQRRESALRRNADGNRPQKPAQLGKPLCQRVRAEALSAVRYVTGLARSAIMATLELGAIPVGT